MSRKFHHWAHLNDEGKKIYGDIFLDGIVPVKLMISSPAKLGDKATRMYKVDLEQLSQDQIDQLLELMSQKFQAPKQAIRKQIEKDGFIPLRESLTSGSGTDQMGLFI